MKKIIYITGLLSTFILAGCSNTNHSDLKDWMKDQRISQKGKIDSLPSARRFIPVAFGAIIDPFKDRPVLSLNDAEKNKLAPDPNRRKEPLEAFGLDQLKMTGILIKDKVTYAMIKAPNGTINYVNKDNYIGLNYGQISKIEEGKMTINERIRDTDEWQIKENHMSLE